MWTRILGAAVVLGGLVQCSVAATITNGFFDFGGTIYVTNPETTAVVTAAGTCPVETACIFWQDGSGTHDQEVDISASGLPNGVPPNNVPASIAGTDGGNMTNLMNPTDGVGVAINVPDFFSFNNGGVTTTLNLTFIEPGFYSSTDCTMSPAVGQSCTLPGSLFNFVNNPPPSTLGTPCNGQCQATATWVLEGTTNTPGVTWTANFTAQFPVGTPYQTVFAEFVSNTFSATLSLTVPEPGTLGMMLIGSGLVGLATLLRRRSPRSR